MMSSSVGKGGRRSRRKDLLAQLGIKTEEDEETKDPEKFKRQQEAVREESRLRLGASRHEVIIG